MDSKEISKLPYDERRMIVVQDAGAADRVSKIPRSVLVLTGAWAGVWAAQMLAEYMERSGVKGRLLTITTSEAAGLLFPVGHPRRKVVYVGHPVDPLTYIPLAQFHTFLFEHKVAEALRLIRALGANSVDVVRVEGWDRNIGIALTIPTPRVEQLQIGANVGVERGQGYSVMTRMQLKPSGPPRVPDDLVWLPHEPLWKEVVDARLTSGLTSFVLDVRSSDDYGVNVSLKALIAKSGFEAGGSFVEHRATLWRLQGTFG